MAPETQMRFEKSRTALAYKTGLTSHGSEAAHKFTDACGIAYTMTLKMSTYALDRPHQACRCSPSRSLLPRRITWTGTRQQYMSLTLSTEQRAASLHCRLKLMDCDLARQSLREGPQLHYSQNREGSRTASLPLDRISQQRAAGRETRGKRDERRSANGPRSTGQRSAAGLPSWNGPSEDEGGQKTSHFETRERP